MVSPKIRPGGALPVIGPWGPVASFRPGGFKVGTQRRQPREKSLVSLWGMTQRTQPGCQTSTSGREKSLIFCDNKSRFNTSLCLCSNHKKTCQGESDKSLSLNPIILAHLPGSFNTPADATNAEKHTHIHTHTHTHTPDRQTDRQSDSVKAFSQHVSVGAAPRRISNSKQHAVPTLRVMTPSHDPVLKAVPGSLPPPPPPSSPPVGPPDTVCRPAYTACRRPSSDAVRRRPPRAQRQARRTRDLFTACTPRREFGVCFQNSSMRP